MHNASYANRLLSYCLIDWDRYIYNSIFYAMCSYVLCCILRFSVHFYVCFQVFLYYKCRFLCMELWILAACASSFIYCVFSHR